MSKKISLITLCTILIVFLTFNNDTIKMVFKHIPSIIKLTYLNSSCLDLGNNTYLIVNSNKGFEEFIENFYRLGWSLHNIENNYIIFEAFGDYVDVKMANVTTNYKLLSLPERLPGIDYDKKETITLVATGDILMHNTLISSGYIQKDHYDFNHFFDEVRHIFKAGDYSSTNLESAMAGPLSNYTGYPLFNCPDETAFALKNAGFDLVVTANNHILDRGHKAAIRTMDMLNNAGLHTTGTFRSQQERDTPLVVDIRGVKIGYLAYSYGTNGIPVPNEHPYFFNFLEPESIKKDINNLRDQVDILVLVLHWGVEYSHYPTKQQKLLAEEFFKSGADVILGSHPHVIQPMEVIKIDDKDRFVIYSMGNFIGDQRGLERNSGVIFELQFEKNFTYNNTSLKKVNYIPTYSHRYHQGGKLHIRVVPVEETIDKIINGEERHLDSSHLPILEKVMQDTTNILGDKFEI